MLYSPWLCLLSIANNTSIEGCVAVCCSVLQHVAACCSVLQRGAVSRPSTANDTLIQGSQDA